MSLRSQFDTLLARARVQGEAEYRINDRASMTVRVKDGRTQLIITRSGVPLGAVEIATFHAHCAVPADAQRFPVEGQSERGGRWRVAWTWQDRPPLDLEEVDLPTLFELPPAEERRGDEPPV